VDGQGERAADALTAVDAGYARDETDEFIKPTVVGDYPRRGRMTTAS
jgi:2,3-bisphosphoglycerate-independent phosphoglycerate mutase